MFPQPLLCYGMRPLRPPSIFGEGIFCLAWIMGGTVASGRNPGLGEKSKQREIQGSSRTIFGRATVHVLDPRSGLKIGDFHDRPALPRKTSPAETGERGILSVSRRAGRGKHRPPGGVMIWLTEKNS